jgi:hypothetical protein
MLLLVTETEKSGHELYCCAGASDEGLEDGE